MAEAGVSFAVIGMCFDPVPQLKVAGYLITRFILNTSCMLVSSVSVNTYFMRDAKQEYHELITEVLSTPDGWNQVAKISDLSDVSLRLI